MIAAERPKEKDGGSVYDLYSNPSLPEVNILYEDSSGVVAEIEMGSKVSRKMMETEWEGEPSKLRLLG
ncbi:hypothetical protein L2E82_45990 [Cichorium intybus]|uniref:Uncharacterized protein n=1 Tax=Cichorium intybus TaxID=13427 RepID=A0ACB8ZVI4_CICIN|nr:hypothetical protein L2E82_45990 [Cichorium intybus]